MFRRSFLVALVFALALTGCKETKPGSNIVQGSDLVTVLDSRFVSDYAGGSTNGIGAGNISLLIVKVRFQNPQPYDYTPHIENFVLQDPQQHRYQAFDQGSASLVGISNDVSPIKKGESREYVFAFRVPDGTPGTIYYEI